MFFSSSHPKVFGPLPLFANPINPTQDNQFPGNEDRKQRFAAKVPWNLFLTVIWIQIESILNANSKVTPIWIADGLKFTCFHIIWTEIALVWVGMILIQISPSQVGMDFKFALSNGKKNNIGEKIEKSKKKKSKKLLRTWGTLSLWKTDVGSMISSSLSEERAVT